MKRILIQINIKRFCSLKQKKENRIKSKRIEEILKKNVNNISEFERNARLSSISYGLVIRKISILFSFPPLLYYISSKFKYPIHSKKLTDSFCSALFAFQTGLMLTVYSLMK
jgi:hypothetical protein